LGSFVIVPASWAKHNSHSYRPSQGAAHDHRFNDIDQALRMFESAERDTWQKPDKVVKQLQLHAGDVVADIGAGTGYFTRRFAAAVGPRGKALGLDIEATMVTYINSEAQKQGIANLNARQVPPMIHNSDHSLSTWCSSATPIIICKSAWRMPAC
jgi:predicted methyltransferase